MGEKVKDVFDSNSEVLYDFNQMRRAIAKIATGLAFLVFSSLAGLYFYIDFTSYQYAVFFNAGVLALLLIIGVLLLFKKEHIPTILLNLVVGPALFANLWIYLGKEIGVHYLYVVLAIVPFVTISRKHKFFQWLFGLANIAIITILINFEPLGSFIDILPSYLFTISNYVVIGVSLLMVIMMFLLYSQQIEVVEQKVKEKAEEVARLAEEIRRMAIEDLSTGAVSRRKLEELIIAEIARSDRYETPFSLIIFSLSDIKEVFAVYGQEKGEKIMEQLVSMVRNDLRLVDILGRWSDGEFVVFMPEIKLHQAVYVSQRLLSIIATKEFFPKIKLPANFAVLQRLPQESFDILTNRLNQLMQKSIEEGENRICN
jgi:diguanylate cyclase (GGDEF)-like protein